MANSYSCSNHQGRCESFWYDTVVLTRSENFMFIIILRDNSIVGPLVPSLGVEL